MEISVTSESCISEFQNNQITPKGKWTNLPGIIRKSTVEENIDIEEAIHKQTEEEIAKLYDEKHDQEINSDDEVEEETIIGIAGKVKGNIT